MGNINRLRELCTWQAASITCTTETRYVHFLKMPEYALIPMMLRGLRSLIILRKNAGFAQSIKGIEVLCGLQGIQETGKLYGIDDIAGWLIEYAKKLAVYCKSKAWTEDVEKSNVVDNSSQ